MALIDGLFGVDPLKAGTELITVAVLIIILFAMYQHWDRVMLALTGDSHMHASCLDIVWYILRCGDMCTGEWTRMLTRWPCVPKKYRNVNIVQAIGRCLGLASHSVELRNITVGDLPYQGTGDFYITVECKANPDQVTSLAERAEAYVVMFPETMTLRMRYSPFEEKVKIRVFELNVFGSTELCYLHLNAMNVIEWSNDIADGSNMKRFEMKPSDVSVELETQPWILVEIGECLEPRDLENMHGNYATVRTATAAGAYEEHSIKEFKDMYVLRDAGGQAIVEPDEDDLQRLKALRWFVVAQLYFWNTAVMLLLVIYYPWRFYLWSCWTQFRGITMAKMQQPPKPFPISLYDLKQLEEKCHEKVQGTGLGAGPCRPSDEDIVETCHKLPAGQPWPGAGRLLAEKWFGVDWPGLHCASPEKDPITGEWVDVDDSHESHGIFRPFDRIGNGIHKFFISKGGVCEMRQSVHPFDAWIVVGSLGLIALTFIFKCIGNRCIRRYKNYLHKARAKDMVDIRSKMKQPLSS